jgi:transcriptional regulator with XRE-family HTH domain
MPKKTLKHFSGAQVKACRERAGLTQATVAAAAGTSRPQLAEIESGLAPNPTVKSIEAIARAIDCDATEFFIDTKASDKKK